MALKIVDRQLQQHFQLLQLKLAPREFRSVIRRFIVVAQQVLIIVAAPGRSRRKQPLRQNDASTQSGSIRAMTAFPDAIETVAGSDHPCIGRWALQILAKVFEDRRRFGRHRRKIIERLVHAGSQARRRHIVAQNSLIHHLRKETGSRNEFTHEMRDIFLSLLHERFLIPSSAAEGDHHNFSLAAWRCSPRPGRTKERASHRNSGSLAQKIAPRPRQNVAHFAIARPVPQRPSHGISSNLFWTFHNSLRGSPAGSLLGRRRARLRVHELPNLGPLLVEICKVLRPLLLVRRQLRLRFFLLSRVHVSLTQPVMRIGNIGIVFQGFHILGNRIGIARLVRKAGFPAGNARR